MGPQRQFTQQSTRQDKRPRVVVVGAGSAGAVIAARLSQDSSINVLLLESGPDVSSAREVVGITSTNFVHALEVSNRNLRIPVRRTVAQDVSDYVRGTGTGGSSCVNAMVGMWGMASDYDRWARDLGCDGWSWSDVAPIFASLPIPLHTTRQSEWGNVDRALVDATVEKGFERRDDMSIAPLCARGVGSVSLTCAGGRRVSVNDSYLEPARSRANLVIRGDSTVDQLLVNGTDVVGVHLANGDDIDADAVVVCAGAIATPQILLRTKIQRDGIGRGVKDHPAVSFTLSLNEPSVAQFAISTLLRSTSTTAGDDERGNIHLLPLNHVGSDEPRFGAMFGALMRVRSKGSIMLDDATNVSSVSLNMLSDERDVVAMREATSMLIDVVRLPAFSTIAHAVTCDDAGTPLSVLMAMSSDQLQKWLPSHVGSYSHIGCSSKMGAMTDEEAVVDTNGKIIGYEHVWVCDASIFPDLPTGNTHLPVVMMAERISMRIHASVTNR